MKKGFNLILIAISVLALFVFPISIYGALVLGLGAVVLAYFKADDKTIKKILQPTIVLTGATVIRGLFGLFLGIFSSFNNVGNVNIKIINFVNGTMGVVNGILYICLFIIAVLFVVLYACKIDMPLVKCLANKIMGESKTKNENIQPDDTEPDEIIIEKQD